MKQFPRIYSLSTLGIIFHNNVDYLLHAGRTDFTGESGAGKSMIADLLQLIFVARKGKQYFKPGTDSPGDAGRDVETLPLDTSGYAFVNIQVEERKFLTIGIHVQRSSGALTAFIIQKGIQWENDSDFLYNNRVLLWKNFLGGGQTIPDIDTLKKNILLPMGFVLEKFSPSEISRYHNLLYHNEILPIDLSQDDGKLISYAQIIQSFARAKSLSLNTQDIKDFLFSDDDDIYQEYKEHVTDLEASQHQYLEQQKTIRQIKERFDALKRYRDALIVEEQSRKTHLAFRAAFDRDQVANAERNYREAKLQLTLKSFTHNFYSVAIKQHDLAVVTGELDQDKKAIANIHAALEKTEYTVASHNARSKALAQEIESRKPAFDLARKAYDVIVSLDALLKRYHSLSKLSEAVRQQPLKASKKERLQTFIDRLKDSGAYDWYTNKEFQTLSYPQQYEKLTQTILATQQQLTANQELLRAFESTGSNSVMAWVLSQGTRSFSPEQESVLRHFILLSTLQPKADILVKRFIPDPNRLLDKLELKDKTTTHFWIDLDGVYERIEIIENRIFTGDKRVLLSYQADLEKQIEAQTKKLSNVQAFKKSLDSAGWSEETNSLFKEFEVIQSFVTDPELPSPAQYPVFEQQFAVRTQIIARFEELENNVKKSYHEQGELTQLIQNETRQKNDLTSKQEIIKKQIAQKTTKQQVLQEELKTEEQSLEQRRAALSDLLTDPDLTATVDGLTGEFNRNRNDLQKFYREVFTPIVPEIQSSKKLKESFENPLSPTHIPKLQKAATLSRDEYYREYQHEFDTGGFLEHPTEEDVSKAEKMRESGERQALEVYESYIHRIAADRESLQSKQPLELVARELLPKVFENYPTINLGDTLEEDVTKYLTSMNESMREIDEHKMKIIYAIFNKVNSLYDDYEEKIQDIRKFFESKTITGGMKVKVDFTPSRHYPINWIKSLRKKVQDLRLSQSPLFLNADTQATTAEEMIIQTFLQHSESKLKAPEIKKLTNPKSYFDLSVHLVRPNGEISDGSSGQAYAKIALLCIARLSRIEQHKRKKTDLIPGIRFMPIDEVAGLGGNFDLLNQIAVEYDYQVITMTINPEMNFENESLYTYMLIPNTTNQLKINAPPFGAFQSETLEADIDAYIQAKTHEEGINVESHPGA